MTWYDGLSLCNLKSIRQQIIMTELYVHKSGCVNENKPEKILIGFVFLLFSVCAWYGIASVVSWSSLHVGN